MDNFDLLILEDDDNEFNDIHLAHIQSFNSDDSQRINFNANRAKDVNEAKRLLSDNRNYCAAIIDLKLAQEVADEGKGNELVDLIYNKYRIPIFIYSNNTALLDNAFSDKGSFLKIYNKYNKRFIDILAEIGGLISTGFISILGRRGIIDNVLNQIFWDHFSVNLEYWTTLDKSRQSVERILVRYISEHIREHLELKEEEKDDFDHYIPEEVYIIPSIKKFVFTGSIVKNKSDEKYYIVLNPPCDFAQDKVAYVLLSEIDPRASILSSQIQKYKKAKKEENEDKLIATELCITKLLGNNYANQYYYLPKSCSFNGGLINFQLIKSLKMKDLYRDYVVFGTVTSTFMKDIIAKFSFYYSRQGSPDFELKDIKKSLLS